MSLEPSPKNKIPDVSGLLESQEKLIWSFLQGAVYCWCKNRPNEWFALRNLVGGDNRNWDKTPLQVLYDNQISLGKSNQDAFNQAAKDAGKLLLKVLHQDTRTFLHQHGRNNMYRWKK